jgi:hypothetical protein
VLVSIVRTGDVSALAGFVVDGATMVALLPVVEAKQHAVAQQFIALTVQVVLLALAAVEAAWSAAPLATLAYTFARSASFTA